METGNRVISILVKVFNEKYNEVSHLINDENTFRKSLEMQGYFNSSQIEKLILIIIELGLDFGKDTISECLKYLK